MKMHQRSGVEAGQLARVDDLNRLVQQIETESRDLVVGELVPTATGTVAGGSLGVAGQRDVVTDLFGELPEIRVLLHLGPREVRASPDVIPPPPIELRRVPAAESPAEDSPLCRHLTQ